MSLDDFLEQVAATAATVFVLFTLLLMAWPR